jgi:hypothetical protein
MAARATSDLTERWSEPTAPPPLLPGAGSPAPATRPVAPASPATGGSAAAPPIAADSRPGAVGADLAILGASRYRFRQAIPVSATNRPVLTSSATPKLVEVSAPRLPTSGTARSAPVTAMTATAANASCEKRRTAEALAGPSRPRNPSRSQTRPPAHTPAASMCSHWSVTLSSRTDDWVSACPAWACTNSAPAAAAPSTASRGPAVRRAA